ncbi:MAG: DNA polymerase I, partial [Planctomycetaceae bacterium]|nr:DNA polymerase I [Planctomycetaceae bacterium]
MATADPLRHYLQIWACDFEFHATPGVVPAPICMVAREYRSGQLIRLWSDQLAELRQPPFPVDAGSLFVAYYASAEFGCFLSLGWPMPV